MQCGNRDGPIDSGIEQSHGVHHSKGPLGKLILQRHCPCRMTKTMIIIVIVVVITTVGR